MNTMNLNIRRDRTDPRREEGYIYDDEGILFSAFFLSLNFMKKMNKNKSSVISGSNEMLNGCNE